MEIINGKLTKVESSDFIDGTLIVPDSVTSIGDSVCRGQQNLKKVILPNTIKFIYNQAFQNCNNLKEINLPNGLSLIGDFAFNKSGIEKLNIPDSVTEIGRSSFSSCDKKACSPVVPSASSTSTLFFC